MKKRYWVFIIFFGVAAIMLILSENLAERQKRLITTPESKQEPDFYVEGLVAETFTDNGKLDYRITAAEAVHYPSNDQTEMSKPIMHYMREDDTAIEIASSTGILKNRQDLFEMRDNVSIVPEGEQPKFLVSTDSLDVYIEKEIAETEDFVLFQGIQSQMSAVGMKIFLKNQVMELKSNVQGQHDPSIIQ